MRQLTSAVCRSRSWPFLLHAQRPSRIVTLAAVAGHGAWTVMIAFAMHGLLWPPFLAVAGAVLAWLLLKELPLLRRRGEIAPWRPASFDITGLVAIAVPLVISGVLWVGLGTPGPLHVAILVTVAVGIVAAVRHRDLTPLAFAAAAGAAGMVLLWPRQDGSLGLSPATLLDLVRLSIAPDTGPGLVWTAALFAAVIGGLPFAALVTRRWAGSGGYVERGCLAFASALAPVCLTAAARLWHDAAQGRIARLGVLTLGSIAIGWAVLALGFSVTVRSRPPCAVGGIFRTV